MAAEHFNSLGGYSVGITSVPVIDANGNIVTNINSLSGNVAANVMYANTYKYANGVVLSMQAAGSNTQIQFNNNDAFGADSLFVYDNYNHRMTVPKITATTNANLGNVGNVTITGGINGYFLQTDGTGNLTWAAASGGGGNGSPGGSNTQIQFNNAGAFGATPSFTFNSATNTVTVPNVNATNVAASSATIGNITTTGNVTANLFIGNGSLITGIVTDTANTVTNNSQPNINSVGILTNLSVSGNIVTSAFVSGSNAQISGTTNTGSLVTGAATVTGNLRTTGNVNLSPSGNITLGNVSNLHISGGLNGYVLTTDGLGNLSWAVGGNGGGGNGTPGGTNQQVQFNDNGDFGASPYFTYDNSIHALTVAGNLIANSIQMGAGIYEFCSSSVYFATTASATPNQVLYNLPIANVSGAEFHIIATDQASLTRQSSKISAIVYNAQVQFNEYAGLQINGGVGTFAVDYNPGDIITPPAMQLKVSPDSTEQIVYRMLITVYSG